MSKEKERLFHWLFKFAGWKKVGMLLLFVISAAVTGWVIYVGNNKGEEPQDASNFVRFDNGLTTNHPVSSPLDELGDNMTSAISIDRRDGNPGLTAPPPPEACPVCFLPVDEAIALMPKFASPSPVLKNLTYISEEELSRDGEFSGSEFGGYPTIKQRNDSYDIRESMRVHCGFVRGKPGRQAGFDIGDSDLLEMERCNGVVVASAIFGSFDLIQQHKNISNYSRKTVYFYMFVDKETVAFLRNNSAIDDNKKSGIWRVVVVHNLPYTDARRTG